MTDVIHPADHRPLRIGVQLAPQHGSYAAYRDAVLRAEDLGVDVIFNWDHFFPLTTPFEAEHFEAWTVLAAIAEQTERVEFGPLVNYESLGRDALLSIPTPDHYLPLLYVLGLRRPDDVVSFPASGIDGGSVSMLSVRLG